MAKATDTPLSLGKLRSPENGRKVKVQENPQNLFNNRIFNRFIIKFFCHSANMISATYKENNSVVWNKWTNYIHPILFTYFKLSF